MATTFQLLLRGLDGRTSCLRFPSSTIVGSLLQEQIAAIFRIPAEALLIVTGTRVINPHTSLYASSDGFFPSCSLLMRLRGGKGGFGSLLRGAATKAGQKKTSNFDACRDMSGRRLRHVNAEKKLKEWKAQAKERELERTANEFLKKQVKQKEDESGSSQVIEKFREETSRARDEVESAVARGLAEAKNLGKRKILEDSLPTTSSKRMHTWFSNEIDMMEEGSEDEREGSEDGDDEEGSKGDDAKEGSEDEVTEEGSEDETQSSEDKKLEEGSNNDKAEQGFEAEKVEGNSVGENVEARSAEEIADTRSEKEEAERKSEFNKAEERFEERDDSNRFDVVLVEKNIQQVDVVGGDGHSILSTTAHAAHVDVDAQKHQSHFCQEKKELRSNILQNCSDSTCNENRFHNDLSNTSFGSVEIKDSPVQEKLNLDDFLHASELEVLGLERLKHELQERGLKCGGSLAERAGRLFLLKTVSIEKLDKKHFAKGRM